MAFTLMLSEVIPLTSELALKHRDLTPSPTERALEPSRVLYLKEKIEAGHMLPFHWATAQLNGDLLRVNGQHSATALTQLAQFPKGGKVHLDQFKADTKDDLALLFRQIDPKKSARSSLDVSGAYQGLYDELKGVPREIAKLAAEGVQWYRRKVAPTSGVMSQRGDDQYSVFGDVDPEHKVHEFVKFCGELLNFKVEEMKRIQVAAAIYATYLVNEPECNKFWNKVRREGDVYNDTDPSTVLDKWLGQIYKKEIEAKPASQIYQGCVYCWNAHRENRQITTGVKASVGRGFLKVTA
jgi:hypothetical protein